MCCETWGRWVFSISEEGGFGDESADLCLSSDFIEPLLPCFLKVAIVRQHACEA